MHPFTVIWVCPKVGVLHTRVPISIDKGWIQPAPEVLIAIGSYSGFTVSHPESRRFSPRDTPDVVTTSDSSDCPRIWMPWTPPTIPGGGGICQKDVWVNPPAGFTRLGGTKQQMEIGLGVNKRWKWEYITTTKRSRLAWQWKITHFHSFDGSPIVSQWVTLTYRSNNWILGTVRLDYLEPRISMPSKKK